MMWWFALALADAPAVLAGDYEVVTIQAAGQEEPSDFARTMHREAMATSEPCYTVRRVFGFGPAPAGEGPYRPATVTVTETLRCSRGGLGTYDTQAGLELEATWSGEGKVTVELPAASVTVQITRLRKARDVGAPAQWIAPPLTWSLEAASYTFDAPARVRDGALTLRDGDTLFGLKPVEAPR